MKTMALVGSVILGSVFLAASGCSTSPAPSPPDVWDDMTAAAATGYCLASHPYRTIHPETGRTSDYPRGFTPDGFEIVPHPPGVVGAVRRNYKYTRTTTTTDEGVSNTCEQACREFGKGYEPTFHGTPLHHKYGDPTTPTIEVSGIGDMASMAIPDRDVELSRDVIAGIRSMGNNWHRSNVARADFCCCTVK